MKKNNLTLIIPNKHDGDIGIGFLTRLLRQAGISKEEWLGEGTQSGLSLIATILTLLIFSLFIAVAVSLVTTGAHIGVQETQGQQAFDIADGGLHYTLALNKSNIPNYSTYGTWITLGAGQFKVDTPAYLDGAIAKSTPPNPSINIAVDSTALFPSAGRITIGTDFGITYTGTDDTHFLNASGGQAHNDHDSVYPATRFSGLPGALLNNCDFLPTIPVDENTGGFQIPGIIFIDTEYFYCAGPPSTNAFQNCTRCYLGSAHPSHPVGRFASQYVLRSTGRITNFLSNTVQRVVRIGAGPWEE